MTFVRFFLSMWLLLLAAMSSSAGCGYDDRSFEGVAFSCDLLHACPADHSCVVGKCIRFPGPPGDDTGTGEPGVDCGGMMCPPSTICCNDFTVPSLACLPASSCTFGAGRDPVTCDGPEDCTGAGSSCCSEGIGGAECTVGGCEADDQICNSNADCPPSAPLCCPSDAPTRPFKVCDTSC